MTTAVQHEPVTLPARPGFEGANIRTWIGFKHFAYLVEQGVLQWFRERGHGPGRLYLEHGVGLSVRDCSLLLPAVLEVDDEVSVTATPGAGGRFAVRIARAGGPARAEPVTACRRPGPGRAGPRAGRAGLGAAAGGVGRPAGGAGRGRARPGRRRRPGDHPARRRRGLRLGLAGALLLLPVLPAHAARRLRPAAGGGGGPLPRRPGRVGRADAARAGLDPGGLPGPRRGARRRAHRRADVGHLHRHRRAQGRHRTTPG